MPSKRQSDLVAHESPLVSLKRSKVRDELLTKRAVDSVRILSAEMVENAKSGHPGAPMGCAPIAHALFAEIMSYSPSNADWFNRDRFVLSNGHACALLYSMLHLTGYNVSLNDLKHFRQLESMCPGHPENFITPGVEVSTGPLGQGISNAVGMAIAERHLAATFNTSDFNIVDHFTYVLCGDGCLQEGISSEASSLAGHLGLGKLIVCYDDNGITIDGETSLSFTEDVGKRYEAYGWHVQTVEDGNDVDAIRHAILNAKEESSRPSMIKIKTIIGFGSAKQGTEGVHGAPLGASDLNLVKQKFSFDPTASFSVPEDVRAFYLGMKETGLQLEEEWNTAFKSYTEKHPDLSIEYLRRMRGELPSHLKETLLTTALANKNVATRNRSEEVLNTLAANLPEIFGGSADLTPSNLTSLKCSGDFQRDSPAGRYVRFGVREHAMAAICNGLYAHGGMRPFCATFLNFIGYALGAVRLSALSRFGVIYIMTHDSIGLGEDGPTHQPVEILESLRAMPNLMTMRPADGNETIGAYLVAIEHKHTPSVISLSRQAAPALEGSSAEKFAYGAYVLHDYITHADQSCKLVLVGSGTEVALCVDVAKSLGVNVRVVSMPCWELFEAQPLEYQLSVFPEGVPVMSVEASGVHGWRKYAHAPFGLESFGMSAPGNKLYEYFGFTVSNLVIRAQEVIAYYGEAGAPSLLKYPRFKTAGHKVEI